MKSREECRLRVGDGRWNGRDPQGTISERLEPETEGFQLRIEVPSLWRKVCW